MTYIESRENSIYKNLKKLKSRKDRNKLGKYFIEGFRLVEEALKAKKYIETIVFIKEQENKVFELLEKYKYEGKTIGISKNLFQDICDTETPQGIGGVLEIENKEVDTLGEFYLLCDKVQDPGNLGTIIRTAHAANIDGIILTKGTVDIYNEKTIRSTMGSMFYIDIIRDDNLDFIKRLKEEKFKIVATSLEESRNFFEEDLSGKIVFVVGNEGNGVSEEIFSLANKKVKIPMPGGAESLNVGVATSIILYEKVRQDYK